MFKSKNPEKLKKSKMDEYEDKFLNPYIAAAQGKVDMVIDFQDTRRTIINILESLLTKREKMPPKKHGNIPL